MICTSNQGTKHIAMLLSAAGLMLLHWDTSAASMRHKKAPAEVQVGSYYTAWSVESGFRLKQLDKSGVAARFTFLNYAFANVYKMDDGTYRCDNGRDLPDEDQGLGMKGSLDYANHFDASESVDGSADTATQALAGNFNQLRQLKANNPKLKVLMALGGGEWSHWFSAGAATESLRRTLVASCIDLYIKGNLPLQKGHGGPGAAAGIFDGIDLDWEHPSVHGMPYNVISPDDKRNFTLLLAEFRNQLDTLSKQSGKKYYLTAAVNSTRGKMDHTEPAQYVKSLDWVNLMTYDFHGAWDKNGPTDFQSNLYGDPANPDRSDFSVDSGVRYFMSQGVPASKIVVGVPFYARGWAGVPPTGNGLYQKAESAAKGFEEGAELYNRLAGKHLTRHYHPITKQLWSYDDGTFWTYDDPKVIASKVQYIRQHKLGGIMSWALDQDDAQFSLSKAMLGLR